MPGSGVGASAGGGGLDSASVGEPEPDRDCDPWGNPERECGAEEVCSFVDMRCHAGGGTAGPDEACQILDAGAWIGTCAPGLVCVVQEATFGRCAIPCEGDGRCDIDRRCRDPFGQAPTNVCVTPCDLFAQNCPAGEACYVLRPDDPGPSCAPEGPGVETDPCSSITDCAVDHHCTSATTHMVPCASEVGCCTPYCDVEINDCVGINPLCISLGVAGDPFIGVCVGDV